MSKKGVKKVINKDVKKGAIELSISTVVVLVLAMAMLVLGIILVQTIFSGAKYNVENLNENVKAEINKLFNEKGGRTYLYLPNNQVDVKNGDSFGVVFSIKNDEEGTAQSSTFTYEVKPSSIQEGCTGLTLDSARKYIILGRTGSASIAPGSDPTQKLIKVQPPKGAPLCEILYDIEVKKGGQAYDTAQMIVKIK